MNYGISISGDPIADVHAPGGGRRLDRRSRLIQCHELE